jgi:hypothetical protein
MVYLATSTISLLEVELRIFFLNPLNKAKSNLEDKLYFFPHLYLKIFRKKWLVLVEAGADQEVAYKKIIFFSLILFSLYFTHLFMEISFIILLLFSIYFF